MSKILALDVGKRRIGLAVGEPEMKLVFPREALDSQLEDPFQSLVNLIEEESVRKLVVGLPLNSDGTENDQCAYTRDFIADLQKKTIVEVEFINEYATTKEAKQRFQHYGAKGVKRNRIDSTAALIILEAYFNKL